MVDDRKFVYKNVKTYDIRYGDVDFKDRLKLSTLLVFLDESAFSSADELGFGYKILVDKNVGFVIANWYIELYKDIMLGENVTVVTWPKPPQHLMAFRDFEIYCGDEKVGVARSRWLLVDLKEFCLKPVSLAIDGLKIEYNDFSSVDFMGWKIPRITDGGVFSHSKKIAYSDYDSYRHMNNTKYADYAMDCFSVSFLENRRLSKVQITYVKQCKESEVLEYYRGQENDIIEGRVGDDVRVQFKVQFDEV